jgi:membrane protein required for colicin V production
MNALDWAIIAVLAIGALHGLRRGAIRMITAAVALFVGFYCASVYYAQAGEVASAQLDLGRSIGAVIGWIAVFMLIFIAIGIVGNAVVRVIDMVHLGFLDRLGGGLLGAAIATMLAGVAVMLLAAVTPDNSPLMRDSQLAPQLMAYSQKIDGFIPEEAKQTYQRNRDELKKYWDQDAAKGAGLALFPSASPSPSGN